MGGVESATRASPDPTEAWDEIDWYKCEKRVRRLQARIVKAVQEGRWGKVKALQHLLTHSFSAKALAVERVTENRRICAKQVYEWVDYQLWCCMWQWAKRRHPNKGKKWIKGRYFHSIGSRNWVFAVRDRPKVKNPEKQYLQLYSTASTKIQRHVKVRASLNPFDTNWRVYLETRKKLGYNTGEASPALYA